MDVVSYYLRLLCMPMPNRPHWARKRRLRIVVLVFVAGAVIIYSGSGVAPAITLATITGVVAASAVVSRFLISGNAPKVAL